MQLNKKYRDDMDQTRVLIPVEEKGNNVRCRVYFDNVCVGFCDQASKLFTDADGNDSRVRWGRIQYRLVSDSPLVVVSPPARDDRGEGGYRRNDRRDETGWR